MEIRTRKVLWAFTLGVTTPNQKKKKTFYPKNYK